MSDCLCFWCNKPVAESDDVVECYFCTHKFHAVICGGVSKEVCDTMKNVINIKFFCDKCLDSNLTPLMGKKIDKLTATVEEAVKKVNCYDELVKKIDSLTNEVAFIKNGVNPVNCSNIVSTPLKRLRNGSLKGQGTSSSFERDENDGSHLNKKKREEISIQGTSDTVLDPTIKVVEESDWFHVSRFDPDVKTEDMKQWFSAILANTNIACIKLLPRNRSKEDLTFISFKLGVPKSLAATVMSPVIWPKNVIVKPFEDRPYKSAKNFRPPHIHQS